MGELTRITAASSAPTRPETDRRRRSRFARHVPVGTCVVISMMLGTAAAISGDTGALLLGIWVALLAVGGWYVCRPRAPKSVALMIADLTADGEVRDSRTLSVVPTRSAAKVLRSRPRG